MFFVAHDEQSFTLTYDGPALEHHVMSVEDFAPSLLAMARLFQDVQIIAAPDQPPAKLDIKATAGGSFIVDLIVSMPGILDHAVDVLLSREVQATLNAAGLFTCVSSAVGFLIWVKNKTGLRRESLEDGQVRITDATGSSIVIGEDALQAAQDAKVRSDAEAMTRPLTSEGLDSISFEGPAKEHKVVIRREDRDAFDIPDQPEESLTDSEREVALRVESPSFVDGNKWRVNDGENSFHAAVGDLSFMTKVESGEEAFRANDTLMVNLRTEQRRNRRGAIQTTHTIQKVIRHIPGPQQIPIPFDD